MKKFLTFTMLLLGPGLTFAQAPGTAKPDKSETEKSGKASGPWGPPARSASGKKATKTKKGHKGGKVEKSPVPSERKTAQ